MSEQNKNSDKSLLTGERSIGQTLFHCTKDQLWRYVEALNYIKKDDKVLDFGCGCGYGSLILSNKAKRVVGIDDSSETIEYAKNFYQRDNIVYNTQDVFTINEQYDSVVALEIIEHIKDIDLLFQHFQKITKQTLILTVPEIRAINNNKFHWKHFTIEEIVQLIMNINFKIKKIFLPKFQGGQAIFCVATKV